MIYKCRQSTEQPPQGAPAVHGRQLLVIAVIQQTDSCVAVMQMHVEQFKQARVSLQAPPRSCRHSVMWSTDSLVYLHFIWLLSESSWCYRAVPHPNDRKAAVWAALVTLSVRFEPVRLWLCLAFLLYLSCNICIQNFNWCNCNCLCSIVLNIVYVSYYIQWLWMT